MGSLKQSVALVMHVRALPRKRGFYMNMRSDNLNRMARTAGSHSDITGPRLREVALRLFSEQGYAAVSMRQIAREVGVQVGALYNYIPDKQGLLVGIMEDHMRDLLEAWAKADPGGAALARLEAFTRFHIAYHLTRRDEVFIAYMELRNLTPDNFARIETLRRAYEDVAEGILRQGQQEGSFHLPDPKIAAYAVIAMLTGVNTWFREDGRLTPEDVESVYWDMVCGAVSGI